VENAERLISCLLYFNKIRFKISWNGFFLLSGAWFCK
jgi:hypothetical protein